ncbi:MAG TPA: secondary thiamine-phosphate synthase enzyme YjbQ [Methylomirabilota bacterium]|jgi:secondary thiamine-phosphate synthase enzyme|nr:secondary thiamine-phosphate synthase enzyme YjbQ [Methylomirabilota bacterium]
MELKVRSNKKCEVIDITSQVSEVVRSANVNEGLCCVYVPHATAAVVINENDDMQIGQDLLDALDRMVPEGIWRHDKIDSNGAAHLKSAILGPSETIPIQNGRLALGTWQAVMFVELDGPRDRKVIVTVK